jgi:prepilin signal peptidase PulO-like enzyme (type II secretory pathway)
MPFGPYLAGAGFLVMVFGRQLAESAPLFFPH